VADDVRVTEQRDVATAWIAARRGVDAAVIGEAIGMAMPSAGQWTSDATTVLVATGPGTWLGQRQDAPPGWAHSLERRMAGFASVSDQTGAYRLFRVEGAGAGTLLQRGVAIDLDHEAFPSGSVAATAIAHIDVVVRRLAAGTAYEVAVYRSYAESFLRWLDAALGSV
jgi:sarcosine oxidase subunit gamma